MSQASTCPKCGTTDIKHKIVKINPNTGERLSMLATGGGAVLLFIGILLAVLGLVRMIKGDDDGSGVMSLVVAFIFLAPGIFLIYPWAKGGQEPLHEFKCKQCKHQWRWMEKTDVSLLKAWVPGSLGILSQTWMELGPNWFTLKDFNKHFDIRKEKAARQIEFLSATYTGTGANSALTGQPLINVGRMDGAIKGIVLEADGFEKLKQWVPPATAKDVKSMGLRNELQTWGKAFIFIGILQGFIVVNLSNGDATSNANMFGIFWAFGLIVIGLLGMVLITPVLLLVDALVIAVAGLLNVTSGTSPWTFFGLFQFFWAAGLCWRFFHYLGTPKEQPVRPASVITPSAPPTPIEPPAPVPADLPMPDLDDIVQPAAVDAQK